MLFQIRAKSCKNLPQSPLKSFQNPVKILPKPSRSPPRTPQEPSFRTERITNSIFFKFFQFVESPRTPKIESKWQKIAKKCKKIEVKKTHVFHYNFFLILRCFGLRKRVPNQAFFTLFSKKAKLCKSLQNTAWAHEFSRSAHRKT